MLITRGVDVSTVADVLGHEQISTTLNMYTSKDGAAKRRAAMVAASDLDAARAGDVLPFMPTKTGTEG
jgi:integrase